MGERELEGMLAAIDEVRVRLAHELRVQRAGDAATEDRECACGAGKNTDEPFCFFCWADLPSALQRVARSPVGYVRALSWLHGEAAGGWTRLTYAQMHERIVITLKNAMKDSGGHAGIELVELAAAAIERVVVDNPAAVAELARGLRS